MKTQTKTWAAFIKGVTAAVQQILGLDKGNKSKRVGVREPQLGIQV